MRFVNMEDKNIFARTKLPAGFAFINKARAALVIMLILLLALSSSIPLSVRATSRLCSNSPGPASLRAAVESRQEAKLTRPYDLLKKGLDGNNYLAPLLEMKAHEAEYLASEQMRESYLEYMTLLHSYVSDYKEAYSYENKLLSSFTG